MSNRKRRKYSGAEKVKILRLHLLEHKPISKVCEEQGIYPTLFYKWQKEFFENGAAAFERQPRSSMGVDYQKEVTALKEKLQRKAEVLSWSTLTELTAGSFVRWIGISPRKWRTRNIPSSQLGSSNKVNWRSGTLAQAAVNSYISGKVF